jgi:hypothetical protein
VHLHSVGASSGTCDHVGYGFSCYSWWLPPCRWLGAMGSLSEGWCLSSASIMVIVRGSCVYSPREITKGNSSGLLMALCTLSCVLMVSLCRARCVMPISA